MPGGARSGPGGAGEAWSSRTRQYGPMGERRGVVVRVARDDEDLDAMNVGNSSWMGGAMMRELFAASGDAPNAALIAEIDGEPVGYGHFVAMGVFDGHRAPATIFVPPSQRGRGAGNALWAAVLEGCTPDRVRGVMLSLDADDMHSRDIALAHGLRLGGLHIESELDLAAMDLADMEQRATSPSGLTVRPLAPDTDEETWHDFAALHERMSNDTPDRAAGSEPASYAVIRAFLAEPWQVMGAWDGLELVGRACGRVASSRLAQNQDAEHGREHSDPGGERDPWIQAGPRPAGPYLRPPPSLADHRTPHHRTRTPRPSAAELKTAAPCRPPPRPERSPAW